MSKKPYRTKHQIELMGVILKAIGEGKELTLPQVISAITYTASYGAIRKTLATLVDQQMLVRKRLGRNTVFLPTERGYDWFRPSRT